MTLLSRGAESRGEETPQLEGRAEQRAGSQMGSSCLVPERTFRVVWVEKEPPGR